MMKFYDALQLDPAILKRNSAACDTRGEKDIIGPPSPCALR